MRPLPVTTELSLAYELAESAERLLALVKSELGRPHTAGERRALLDAGNKALNQLEALSRVARHALRKAAAESSTSSDELTEEWAFIDREREATLRDIWREREILRALEPGGPERTVLVVEDDAALRSVVQTILERRGYAVLEAGSSEQALCVLARHPEIDLLVLDVVLPMVSGPDLWRAIRGVRPDARVLFMSGYPAKELASHSLDEGAPFVQKPFSAESLTRKVRDVLGNRAARSEAGAA